MRRPSIWARLACNAHQNIPSDNTSRRANPPTNTPPHPHTLRSFTRALYHSAARAQSRQRPNRSSSYRSRMIFGSRPAHPLSSSASIRLTSVASTLGALLCLSALPQPRRFSRSTIRLRSGTRNEQPLGTNAKPRSNALEWTPGQLLCSHARATNTDRIWFWAHPLVLGAARVKRSRPPRASSAGVRVRQAHTNRRCGIGPSRFHPPPDGFGK